MPEPTTTTSALRFRSSGGALGEGASTHTDRVLSSATFMAGLRKRERANARHGSGKSTRKPRNACLFGGLPLAGGPNPALEQAMSTQGLMSGKRGLVMGVANDRSIAWGIAKAMHDAGAELAFTYQGDVFRKRVS